MEYPTSHLYFLGIQLFRALGCRKKAKVHATRPKGGTGIFHDWPEFCILAKFVFLHVENLFFL